MANRLDLDFSIDSNIERTKLVNEVIEQLDNPTAQELETMSNYILYGKDPDTQTSPVQRKEIQIEARYSPWKKPVEQSLQALQEANQFPESYLLLPPISRKTKKFDRDYALTKAPPHIKVEFEELFKEIDKTELICQLYDNIDIREELKSKFTPEEIESYQKIADDLSPYRALKYKRRLVELRKAQFPLQDFFAPQITQRTPLIPLQVSSPIFAFEPVNYITTKEIGMTPLSVICQKAFQPLNTLIPSNFTPRQIHFLKKFLECDPEADLTFNLSDPDSLGVLLLNYQHPIISYYIKATDLTPPQAFLLDGRIQGIPLAKIQIELNKKFNRSHRQSYLSTMFRQQIIPKLCETVRLHRRLLDALIDGARNFQVCRLCGTTKLLDDFYFTRSKRSKTGFNNVCKTCVRNRELNRRKK